MSAFVLSAMGPTQVRTHTPRGVLSRSTRTRAAVRPLTKPKRSRLIANAGFDDMGNPIGRDVTFGRGVFTEVETTESSESSDSFSFWGKVKAAFAIFFPPSEEETARLEAKKRLRMILVADRCSLSGGAMTLMKQKVVEAVCEFLDVDLDDEVQITTSQDPDSITTLYAVSIPVKGVKPEFDVENETYGWDEEPLEGAPYDDDAWKVQGK